MTLAGLRQRGVSRTPLTLPSVRTARVREVTFPAMPRPFRFEPPAEMAGLLERGSLLQMVARRWHTRVVSVVAGPGFGKTCLLSMAWRMELPLRGVQTWLTCEAADESVEHLRHGVASALGLRPNADTAAILDELWSRAPTPVCLIFDDVHEVSAGSAGAQWLEDFVAEMSANVHVVFASRDAVPVSLARLTAAGQAVRITEADLVFSPAELGEFADRRGVPAVQLVGSGGWPALAELQASAGADLQSDFLWEEVLGGLGHDRGQLLARFAACGGGDDEVAAAVAERNVTVDDIVRGIPLVSRSVDGWASVHPLWHPALRRVLPSTDAQRARSVAAAVHRRRGRFSSAMYLLAEAEAWDDLFDVIVEAEQRSVLGSSPLASTGDDSATSPHEFGRWYRLLPAERRDEPAALLAHGIELQTRDPDHSVSRFRRAADGFRAKGDAQGELAAISREGVIHWWRNDMGAIMELYGRVIELAQAGVERAATLAAVGLAAVAHLGGDSPGVLSALAAVDDHDADRGWLPTAHWLRSVAYRRDGDLESAHRELDRVESGLGLADPQMGIARLRIEWLQGDVDRVAERLRAHHRLVASTRDGFLVREAALEAAARTAWLGDVDGARALLADSPPVDEIANPLAQVLEAIAVAAIAIEEGDEQGAATALRTVALDGPAALGTAGGWYWRDRATMVLLRTLVPESAIAWAREPLPGAHAVGRDMAEAFAGVRAGNESAIGGLRWPSPCVVRAHLPRRWVGELMAAGVAAGNPPPDELVLAMFDAATEATIEERAKAPEPLAISVLGPLTIERSGLSVDSPIMRRARVRELLSYLVAFRVVRREVVADELWPDANDAAHNLRVTLNYLHQLLEPDRAAGHRSVFVQATKEWLSLTSASGVAVDLWALEEHLDQADAAEEATDIRGALGHYAMVLSLWRGEPLADTSYAPWAEPVRAVIRARFIAAALRAGELWLSAGDLDAARRAAERALAADRFCEPAHQLLIRSHLAAGNRSAALMATEACRVMLAELGIEMQVSTG